MASEELAGVSDTELIARHVAGDPEVFGEIFRRHRDRMWALALRTTGDRELAADCVQDAFVSAYRRAASYRGDAALTTWLHRIVVNACLDRLRRTKATSPWPDVDPADPADRYDQAIARVDVREALAQLPEQQRLALVLVDMHGMSVSEAAEVLGVAEGTVKSRCFRGRAAMAALLRPPQQGTDPGSNASDPPRTADPPPNQPTTTEPR